MTAAHTPTPWHFVPNDEAPTHAELLGPHGHDGDAILYHGADWAMTPANKEFIVRACNSHDALLAALEDAERQITFDEVQIEGEWGNCRNREQMEADHAWSDTVYAARAAIKLAKGEA